MADTDPSLYNLRYNQLSSNLEAFGGGSPQWTLITLNNVDPQQVPITRLINTTAPLQGGGNLSADRTLSITESSSTVDGYLSSVDWNTFNNKQVAGNYITALTGDGTAAGPGSVPLTLATVNGNVGTFSYASITVNGKGLITSASNGATGSLTDTGTDGIIVTGGTGAVIGSGTSIAQQVADTTHNGYLSSTDWNTFNNKQSTITTGDLTDIGTDGITVIGGMGAVIGTGTSISQHVADTTHNGYLTSTDWNTFNNKQAAGSYITALTSDITASGPGSAVATLATVNSNVGSFTNASITVNGKGLITAASSGATGVTSVSGTTNQITSTGGATPVLALASPLTTPGAATISGNLTFTPTTAGIVGTTTNNNTTAGNVGEYIAAVGNNTNATTSGNWGDIVNISLTAGDWDVLVSATVQNNGATVTNAQIGLSSTSGNSAPPNGLNQDTYALPLPTTQQVSGTLSSIRVSISSTTTYYLKYLTTYTVATPNYNGYRISARRVR